MITWASMGMVFMHRKCRYLVEFSLHRTFNVNLTFEGFNDTSKCAFLHKGKDMYDKAGLHMDSQGDHYSYQAEFYICGGFRPTFSVFLRGNTKVLRKETKVSFRLFFQIVDYQLRHSFYNTERQTLKSVLIYKTKNSFECVYTFNIKVPKLYTIQISTSRQYRTLDHHVFDGPSTEHHKLVMSAGGTYHTETFQAVVQVFQMKCARANVFKFGLTEAEITFQATQPVVDQVLFAGTEAPQVQIICPNTSCNVVLRAPEGKYLNITLQSVVYKGYHDVTCMYGGVSLFYMGNNAFKDILSLCENISQFYIVSPLSDIFLIKYEYEGTSHVNLTVEFRPVSCKGLIFNHQALYFTCKNKVWKSSGTFLTYDFHKCKDLLDSYNTDSEEKIYEIRHLFQYHQEFGDEIQKLRHYQVTDYVLFLQYNVKLGKCIDIQVSKLLIKQQQDYLPKNYKNIDLWHVYHLVKLVPTVQYFSTNLMLLDIYKNMNSIVYIDETRFEKPGITETLRHTMERLSHLFVHTKDVVVSFFKKGDLGLIDVGHKEKDKTHFTVACFEPLDKLPEDVYQRLKDFLSHLYHLSDFIPSTSPEIHMQLNSRLVLQRRGPQHCNEEDRPLFFPWCHVESVPLCGCSQWSHYNSEVLTCPRTKRLHTGNTCPSHNSNLHRTVIRGRKCELPDNFCSAMESNILEFFPPGYSFVSQNIPTTVGGTRYLVVQVAQKECSANFVLSVYLQTKLTSCKALVGAKYVMQEREQKCRVACACPQGDPIHLRLFCNYNRICPECFARSHCSCHPAVHYTIYRLKIPIQRLKLAEHQLILVPQDIESVFFYGSSACKITVHTKPANVHHVPNIVPGKSDKQVTKTSVNFPECSWYSISDTCTFLILQNPLLVTWLEASKHCEDEHQSLPVFSNRTVLPHFITAFKVAKYIPPVEAIYIGLHKENVILFAVIFAN